MITFLSESIVAVNAQETGDDVVVGLETSIEEIIVTANKREQLLNEVAMAITAITAEGGSSPTTAIESIATK